MDRPHFNLSAADLSRAVQRAAADVDALRALRAELAHRSSAEARRLESEVDAAIAAAASPPAPTWDGPAPPPAFVTRIAEVLGAVRPTTTGKHHVYCVVLWNADASGAHAVYIGLTGTSPDERYQNHKRDHKAGRGKARDFGIGLLRAPFRHLEDISYEEARTLERDVARRLKQAGIAVYGGT